MTILRFCALALFFVFLGPTLSSQEYVPDEELRTELRSRVWNSLKSKTPKKQRFMTGLFFNSNQCFTLFEKAARQRGWPIYEPATIVAFREVVIQEAIIKRDFTENEIKAVYQETRARLKKEKPNTSTGNRELQEKYDPLIIEALWIGTVTELSKGRNDDAKNLALALLEEPKSSPIEDNVTMTETPALESSRKTKEEFRKPLNSPLVEDIILRTVTNYGLNGAYIDNEVSILFKNGDLMTNPQQPLNQLNVMQSKKKSPKKWATWEKKGDVLWVTKAWKNKTYDWKTFFKLRPAKENTKIIGTYKTLDAFGGDRVINASTVSFDSQGRFAWKTIKGGNTSWKPIYSKTASSGTYQLDNYAITLTYNNGKKESFFFGFYPKDDQHFVIGPGHFVPMK